MKKTVKRASIILALTPLVSVPVASAAFAATSTPTPVSKVVTNTTTTVTTHTDAPAAHASADAAKVSGVLSIGSTDARADKTGSEAHADSLTLLGTRVFGGDAKNGTSSKGSAIGTGDTPLGDAEVAPWSAQSQQQAAGWKAVADAALAHVNLADIVEIWVLHSHSEAVWAPDASRGDSSSDGAEVNVGGGALDVKVLHSEAHSGAKGKSDLLVINGNEIGSSDQVNGACQLDADPLVKLICLTAEGGTGSNGTTTSGGTVGQVTGVLPGTTLVGSSSSGGHATTPAVTTPGSTHKPARQPQHGPLPHTSGPAASGALPFTGAETGMLAAYGAALAALGIAIVTLGRRRRGGAALA